MEQLIFLALIAVVGLLRWFSQMAEEKRNREAEKRAMPPPNAPLQRAPAQTEEERIRRFMEALGVPTPPAQTPTPPRQAERTHAPPPPQEAPQKPARKVLPIDPFPVPRTSVSPPPAPAATPPPLAQPPPLVPPAPVIPRTVTAAPPAGPAVPLPTRETTVLADVPAVRRSAEAEASDVWGATEDAWRVPGSVREKAGGRRAVRETTLVARLATPEGLREAMVLREIFGPPRSMQPLEPHRVESI